MKAQKVKISIEVEVLSVDVLKSMLAAAVDQIEREAESGMLRMSDGDEVSWSVIREDVEF